MFSAVTRTRTSTLTGAPVFGTRSADPVWVQSVWPATRLIHNYSLATGFDYTLSTSLLTDFRFGWFRYNPHSTKFDANAHAATALGLPGSEHFRSRPPAACPALIFDQTIGQNTLGNNGIGEGLGIGRCNCPLIEKEQGIQFVNNWTKMLGNHQFKFGADLRHANESARSLRQ